MNQFENAAPADIVRLCQFVSIFLFAVFQPSQLAHFSPCIVRFSLRPRRVAVAPAVVNGVRREQSNSDHFFEFGIWERLGISLKSTYYEWRVTIVQFFILIVQLIFTGFCEVPLKNV